jgi:type II secretory pathway pseudopilin PulG
MSVIEIVTALLIIGIVTVIAVTKWQNIESCAPRLAARQLVNQLRYARSISLFNAVTTRIVFNIASNQYAVYTNSGNSFVIARNPATRLDWIIRIDDDFPAARLTAANFNGGNILMFGLTNGIPCDSATQALSSAGSIVFNNGHSVSIAPDTGYVSISE